jgi:hypothetical protein
MLLLCSKIGDTFLRQLLQTSAFVLVLLFVMKIKSFRAYFILISERMVMFIPFFKQSIKLLNFEKMLLFSINNRKSLPFSGANVKFRFECLLWFVELM